MSGFGVLLFNSVIGNSRGSAAVGLDGCRGLWVAKFKEHSMDRVGLFTIVEFGSKFSLGGTGDNFMQDFGRRY